MTKKFLYTLALLALVGLAGAVVAEILAIHRPAPIGAAKLLPASTLALIELPDGDRTAGRWPKTALHALWEEPEVRDFLAQPMEKYPPLADLQKELAELSGADVRQAFLAITSLEGDSTHYLGGLSLRNPGPAGHRPLPQPAEAFRAAHPASKSDLLRHGEDEIETFTDGPAVLAQAASGSWFFLSDSVAELEAALDRLHHPKAEGSLEGDDLYQHATKPLPGDPEIRGFLRLEPLTERLTTLLAASGQTVDAAGIAELKRQRALGFTTRMEGSDLQDTLFSYAPGQPAEPKGVLAGLELTTPDTLVFYAGAFSPKSLPQLAPLAAALGPTVSLSLDWPAGSQPNFAISAPVVDASKLHHALETIFPPEARSEINGVQLYTISLGELLPLGGLLPISPVLAVNDRIAALGLAAAPLAATLQRAEGKAPTLSGAPAFQGALASVPPAQGTFGYVNLGAFVDRAYGTTRPILAMALALDSASTPYVDASKLPSAGALTKHLGTSAFSRTATPEGELLVARGAVTIPELFLGVAAAGVAAFPAMQRSLPSGFQWPKLPEGH